jgi:elongation factor G
MDGVVDFLPSPLQRPPVVAHLAEGSTKKSKKKTCDGPSTVARAPSTAEPLAMLAFKVTHDSQKRPVVFVRVYSGAVSTREALFNTNQGILEKPAKLIQVLSLKC